MKVTDEEIEDYIELHCCNCKGTYKGMCYTDTTSIDSYTAEECIKANFKTRKEFLKFING